MFLDKIKNQNIFNIRAIIFYCSVFIILTTFALSLSGSRKEDVLIHISKNENPSSITKDLKSKNVIENEIIFKKFLALFYKKTKIQPGDYLIPKNSNFFLVAKQLATGDHKIKPLKITIREGLTNEEISEIFKKNNLINFNKEEFLNKTKDKQGYLFPDTYFIYPLTSTEEIVDEMSVNFENRIKKIKEKFKYSPKAPSDIIVMASILEGEAKGNKDNKIISGILWKRIDLDMPLQVDVDKATYKQKGLPKYPLNNPGIDSILAAIDPDNSPYLYYIHDKEGNSHFSTDYSGHLKNINSYLRKK